MRVQYSIVYRVTILFLTHTTADNYSLGSISRMVMRGYCFIPDSICVNVAKFTFTVGSEFEIIYSVNTFGDKSIVYQEVNMPGGVPGISQYPRK